MKDGILFKKKRKKERKENFASLGGTRKLSLLITGPTEIHPLSILVRVFHEHNLTFQKVFTRLHDIPLKCHCYKLYTEIYNEALQR